MGYKHLTIEQRYTIMVLHQPQATISRIAEVTGKSKGTDFSNITDEMLSEIVWKLNNRPRKSSGYMTPLECCKTKFNFDFENVAI